MKYVFKYIQILVLTTLLSSVAYAKEQRDNVIPELFLKMLQEVPEHPTFLINVEVHDKSCLEKCLVELVVDHNTQLLDKENKEIDLEKLEVNEEYQIDFYRTENININRVIEIKLTNDYLGSDDESEEGTTRSGVKKPKPIPVERNGLPGGV